MTKNHYNTSITKRERAKTAILVLVLMILAALTVFEFTCEEKTVYDSVSPIANAHISWNQSFYGR